MNIGPIYICLPLVPIDQGRNFARIVQGSGVGCSYTGGAVNWTQVEWVGGQEQQQLVIYGKPLLQFKPINVALLYDRAGGFNIYWDVYNMMTRMKDF